MDALANYGSDDSNSSADDTGKGISGLLGHYSDSDNDDAATTSSNIEKANDIVEVNKEGDDKTTNSEDEGQPNKKKRRRWDNPKDDSEANADIDINSVLPAPKLSSTDTYQSLTAFNKDYTTNLRRKLAQQLQTQTRERGDTVIPAEKQQLNNKLEQLYEKFQQNESTTSSFAKHIKNQEDFGNPHLLKSVIDHYELKGLGSNIGNSFKSFEQIDRLVVAEEKARIAQANNS